MKLIIINGPCGVGKTTTSVELHDLMPLSFLLDVDAQMRNISHYREYREERWDMTFEITKAILHSMLKLGRDVIVEKMVYDSATLDLYREIGEEYGAEIHEVVLWATKDVVMQRSGNRGLWDGSLLIPKECELFWEKIDAMKGERLNATLIDSSEKSLEEVLDELRIIIA
ncbi:MAG: AAA family ATPase [bacterium]|nr:AAA family ATPase [bacterium]